MILKIIYLYVSINMLLYFILSYYRLQKEAVIINNGWTVEKEWDGFVDFIKDVGTFLVPIHGQIGLLYVLLVTINTVKYKKEDLNGIISIKIPYTKITLIYDDESLKETLSKNK